MATGKIKTLYSDKEKTEALFPRTKTSAVSDADGVGLDAIIENMVHVGDAVGAATAPVDADSLGGRPAGDYATQSFVTNKIAEAQVGGSGNIDLSGYATKDDLNTKQDTITGAVSTIVTDNLNANVVPISNANGKIVSSNITATELGYLDGVTSNIQTQLDARYKKQGTRNSSSSVTDFDLLTDLGAYWIQCAGMTNTPFGDNASGKFGHLEVINSGSGVLQRFTQYGSNGIVAVYERDSINGWKTNWTRTDVRHGLGESETIDWSNVDNITSNGWYRMSNVAIESAPSISGWCYMLVSGWNNESLTQTLYCTNYLNTSLSRSRNVNGWGEWEWVNPPMVFGVEYRTTERYNDKTVYAKLVNYGTMPNNTQKGITVSSQGVTMITYAEGIARHSGGSTHVPLGDHGAVAIVTEINSSKIILTLQATTDFSAWSAYVLLKYIKN